MCGALSGGRMPKYLRSEQYSPSDEKMKKSSIRALFSNAVPRSQEDSEAQSLNAKFDSHFSWDRQKYLHR
jgi:hypothetical protein